MDKPVNRYEQGYLIYSIEHPVTHECVWVGLTKAPAWRFTRHMNPTNMENVQKTVWLNGLLAEGKKPVIVILDWAWSEVTARIKEAKAIKQKLLEGHPLFNSWVDLSLLQGHRKQRPVKDGSGRVYSNISEAVRLTGIPRRTIRKNLTSKTSLRSGHKFEYATYQELVEGYKDEENS